MGDPSLDNLSPAMKQYRQFKRQYPDCVLFFRMGDFYEMFWEDAELCARVLGVALTSRNKGPDAIPMAGVPYHAVEGYLRKMIAAGHRVAICEQTEDAAQAKGLVKRDVVRVMTPGTLTDEALLDGRASNFVAAVAAGVSRAGGYQVGLAWAELSTGAFVAAGGPRGAMLDELSRIAPSELLVPEQPSGEKHELAAEITKGGFVGVITARPGWQFTPHHAAEMIRKQWGTRGAGGFGFEGDDPALLAVAAVLSYLEDTQKSALAHLRPPRKHESGEFLAIDAASWRSLEVERTVRTGGVEGSLFAAIDRTRTSMGARLLRQWLRYPLRETEHIRARQQAVSALVDDGELAALVGKTLDGVCDVERVVSRVAVNRAGPRDLAALARSLANLPPLLDELGATRREVAPELATLSPFCRQWGGYLSSAIKSDCALNLREGGVIAEAHDPELDRLRAIGLDGAKWLAAYQSRLAGETGITTVRVSYNRVFGYYIEVTDTHRAKVPPAWIRKQTVRNAERYITEELKKFEEEALSAGERAIQLEQKLFELIRQKLLPELATLQDLAAGLARLDVLAGLAVLARERRYCRPEIVESRELHIVGGRHPVLEAQLGGDFVANDIRFEDADTVQLITGPNMAGKSTFIRQVALIVLLAQVGSFVPADSAVIGVADRLFTRIGASDELHGGQSTFMVEMTETANLINNATPRSLVVLDEVGRGTSTLDGLSLAWAIVEHIAAEVRCRTLFATHYHELTELRDRFRGVRNLSVAVREWNEQVVFLHKIVEGAAERSYGIHVARLAGIPAAVLERSRQLLGELSVQHVARPRVSKSRRSEDLTQLPLFEDPLVTFRRELADLKLQDLSPAQLFEWLEKWKGRLK
jgi:DNA mismatch repair protein MutS